MYNAPAVIYPVGRSRFQAGLTLAVVLAGATVQAVWWLVSTEHGMGHILVFLFWCVTSGWAIWSVLHTPHAQLAWDGQCWLWRSGTTSLAVEPQVIVDGQDDLLLCLHLSPGAVKWAWPARPAMPERWLALRRALFNTPAHSVEPVPSPLPESSEA